MMGCLIGGGTFPQEIANLLLVRVVASKYLCAPQVDELPGIDLIRVDNVNRQPVYGASETIFRYGEPATPITFPNSWPR